MHTSSQEEIAHKGSQVLSPGQWEALLFQVPSQVKPLLIRLAVHHGYIDATDECPLCKAKVAT